MAGQVTFTVSAETAKAVDGVLKIVSAQGKVVEGFKHVHEHGNKAHEMLKEFGHELLAIGTGWLSFEGGKRVIEEVVEALMHGREELNKFYESAKGGLTIGDNAQHVRAYKQRSIALSNAFAVPVEQVNAFREVVETKASNKTPAEREEIEKNALLYGHITGKNPTTIFETERKISETFDVGQKRSGNIMEFLRQKGGLGIDEQAELLPTLLPAAGAMNMSPDQFQAIMSVIAKSGGRDSQVGRGLQEVLLKVPELREKGIIGEGSREPSAIFEDLARFQKQSPDEFGKAVGIRGQKGLAYVMNHPDVYTNALAEAQDPKNQNLMEQAEKGLRAPGMSMAVEGGQLEQMKKNADLMMSPENQRRAREIAVREAGFKQNVTEIMGVAPPDGFAKYAGMADAYMHSNKPWIKYSPGAMLYKGETALSHKIMGTTPWSASLGESLDPNKRTAERAIDKASEMTEGGDSGEAHEAHMRAADALERAAERLEHARSRTATME